MARWQREAVRDCSTRNWKTSEHATAGVTCASCHSVHEASTKFATRKPGNELCVSCHSTVSTDPVYGHAPIANAPQHPDCIGCHMAPTGKSAESGRRARAHVQGREAAGNA